MRYVQVKKMMMVSIWIILAFSVCLRQNSYAYQPLSPFTASSVSALLMDANTGHILYSQNPDFRMQPASLAKMMTLFLIFDALNQGTIQLNDEVLISKKAAQAGGSKMYLRAGNKVPLDELIKGIAVVSGNDACLAVAEWLFGEEHAFIDKMNQKLDQLKIQNSKFQSVDGWPVPDQYTTAYDMVILAQAYIRQHPEALQYHKLKEFSHETHVLHNRNGLVLQDPSVDGLKTGHVEEAGYHLLASAKRESQRFIAVIMGAKKISIREKEAMQLLNFGFNNFMTVKLFQKGQILAHLPVSKGTKDQVGLAPQVDGILTIPVIQKENISFKIKSPDRQEAPIQLDQELGTAIISVDQKNILKTVPMFATEKIERAGFIKISLQTLEVIVAKHKINLLIIMILICIIGLQTWYNLRLRRQIQSQFEDDNLVKERLNKILKPTETE